MYDLSKRSVDSIQNVVQVYGNTLFRLCYVMLGNREDAEDAVQETIIKYMQKAPDFASPEHEKAWLLATAKNQCRDMLRFRLRHPQIHIGDLKESPWDPSDSGILEALMSLPEKFRLVLTLYYVEEYAIAEIAGIIQKTPSAVKMRLQKGRRLLEAKYRKEYL